VKTKVNLERAVQKFKEATQAVKKEVAELRKEKPPPVERGTGEGEGSGITP
jgi:hypothetical protein